MKVLLIFPKIGSSAKWMVGLAFISSVLKEAGHDVELIEIEDREGINNVIPFIRSYRPRVVGLSANSHQYVYATLIAREIKLNFDLPVFLGGVHTTIKPDEAIKEESFDGISIGEAEYAFLELIERIEKGRDYTDINNFWFRKEGRIIKNNIGPLVENLDKLPFPDYSIFKYFREAGKKDIVPRFIFSRGCPFNCTYCCNHVFKKVYTGCGNYLRFRSVDKAIEEIELVKKQYNLKHCKIDDDTFSLNKAWVLEFCKKYSEKFDMSFECNIRPGAVDKETLEALKQAGCSLIKIGLETGNDNLRRKVLGRNITSQQIVELFSLAKEIGLLTFSFNMIGVPGENKKTIKETIDLNVRIKPNFMQVTAFYPYPGTLLGEECIRDGLVVGNHIDSYIEESVLNLPDLTSQEIRKAVKNFSFNVYRQYNWRKALDEKKKEFKKFIALSPIFSKLAKPVYKLIKSS